MRIVNCDVNHIVNPIGFQMDAPVFHWNVEHADGAKQTAARIIIRKDKGIVADTGWEELDSLATRVDLELAPRTRYYWTVSVRTDAGEEATSEENFFETGKRNETWVGKWIHSGDKDADEERHPVFRKRFQLPADKSGKKSAILSARLYICGLGLYEAWINGQRVGKEYLTPYCDKYDSIVQYQTYDVADYLRYGEEDNELSVLLGYGWYSGRFGLDEAAPPYYGHDLLLMAELHVRFADGSESVIGTDDTWLVGRSNLTFSNIYDGEHRDDTLSSGKEKEAVLAAAPKGKLIDRISLPVVIREELPVKELLRTPKGEMVVDLGQNMAGSFRLHVHGVHKGDVIHVQVGEVLQNGNFYRDNLRSAKAEYIYVSNGEDLTLQPHFTFYGYRYAKIEGMPALKAEDFTGLVMYSDMREIGHLTTGNDKINRLILNAEWGKRSNFIDVPTDCPQRDERMGWTGDAEVFSPTALFQSDAYAFYTKYLYDMALEQKELDGCVPDVVPSFGMNNHGTCAWSDATTIIPWNMYLWTGDKTILEQHFDAMTSWVDYVTRLEADGHHGWRDKFHYGDWLALDGDGDVKGGTDNGYLAMTYYLYSTRITAKTAEVIGRPAEAEKYRNLAGTILAGIRNDYFSEAGHGGVYTQTGYLLAICHGLSEDQEKMKKKLVENLDANDDKLQTGFIGTPLLAETLTEIGRSDLAYKLLLNEEYPGWLYEVNLGATTIWERWNSMLPDGSFSSVEMNSFNHYSYGAIVQWIYERAAGLRRDPAVPGFRKVDFVPIPDARLGQVDVSYASAAGTWRAHWKIIDTDVLEISLTVPFGCRADVILPYVDEKTVKESGNPFFTSAEKVMSSDCATEDIGTGRYVSHVGTGQYSITYAMTRHGRQTEF